MAGNHRHGTIQIIVNDDFLFVGMEPVEPANILLKGALPRDRHREKKGVEPRVVKSFTDVASRREKDAVLLRRDLLQAIHDAPALFHSHAATKDDQIFDRAFQPRGEKIEMIDPFRQDQWRSASTDSVQHVLHNEGIAGFVVSQRIVNFVNGRLVSLWGKPKSCRTRDDNCLLYTSDAADEL